jgi:hypothetical protein
MFDINLKSEFAPLNLMKTFDRNHTGKSFESGRLQPTTTAHPVDIDNL